jgi:hypothetical protein
MHIPSYAGLTRVSITLQKTLAKKMDCRVKPGNDDRDGGIQQCLDAHPVIRGLDPRIHHSSKDSCKKDGLPGQARQ